MPAVGSPELAWRQRPVHAGRASPADWQNPPASASRSPRLVRAIAGPDRARGRFDRAQPGGGAVMAGRGTLKACRAASTRPDRPRCAIRPGKPQRRRPRHRCPSAPKRSWPPRPGTARRRRRTDARRIRFGRADGGVGRAHEIGLGLTALPSASTIGTGCDGHRSSHRRGRRRVGGTASCPPAIAGSSAGHRPVTAGGRRRAHPQRDFHRPGHIHRPGERSARPRPRASPAAAGPGRSGCPSAAMLKAPAPNSVCGARRCSAGRPSAKNSGPSIPRSSRLPVARTGLRRVLRDLVVCMPEPTVVRGTEEGGRNRHRRIGARPDSRRGRIGDVVRRGGNIGLRGVQAGQGSGHGHGSSSAKGFDFKAVQHPEILDLQGDVGRRVGGRPTGHGQRPSAPRPRWRRRAPR